MERENAHDQRIEGGSVLEAPIEQADASEDHEKELPASRHVDVPDDHGKEPPVASAIPVDHEKELPAQAESTESKSVLEATTDSDIGDNPGTWRESHQRNATKGVDYHGMARPETRHKRACNEQSVDDSSKSTEGPCSTATKENQEVFSR